MMRIWNRNAARAVIWDGNLNCWTCGDEVRKVDSSGCSSTFQCVMCGYCSLVIALPTLNVVIRLSDFHLKRGDTQYQRPLNDFGMAKQLVESLCLDCWPSPATIVDFGINSSSHLGALQCAVLAGCTAYDLDRVMGDGPAITQLVRAVPDQLYPFVEFRTVYDGYCAVADGDDLV